jgi:hypothetical protein
MAYKFQLGTTTLSGSTTFEENLTSQGQVEGNTVVSKGIVSGSGDGRFLALDIDGTEVISSARAIANVTTISGSGTLTAGAVTTDGTVTFGSLSGSGNVQAGGNLTIFGSDITFDALASVNQALDVTADAIFFKDNSDSDKLSARDIGGFVGDLSGEGIEQSSQKFQVKLSGSASGLQRDGGGIRVQVSASGGVNVDGDGLSIALDGITPGLTLAGAGLSLDLNNTAGGTVNVAQDSIAFIDQSDTDNTKKETIADLVAAMAGAGLQASSGSLSTDGAAVATAASGSTLVTGVNYFANISALAGVTMPASGNSTVGDRVTVKAADGVSATNYIEIKTAASAQKIDGRDEIRLESPYAAVTLVYVVADEWRLI